MMYYRIAFRVEQARNGLQPSNTTQIPTWRWRSTILTSPRALFTLLKTYTAMPKEHVRIFFTASEEAMEEMLSRHNRGLISSSLTAEQFLIGKAFNALDMKRLSYELSPAEDHDIPYIFTPPTSLSEHLAWTRLLTRVYRGELQP